jgi:hypothetical protein
MNTKTNEVTKLQKTYFEKSVNVYCTVWPWFNDPSYQGSSLMCLETLLAKSDISTAHLRTALAGSYVLVRHIARCMLFLKLCSTITIFLAEFACLDVQSSYKNLTKVLPSFVLVLGCDVMYRQGHGSLNCSQIVVQYTFSVMLNNLGFEVFTAVVMKSINFWDITPESRISGWRIILLATCLLAGFLVNLFLRP